MTPIPTLLDENVTKPAIGAKILSMLSLDATTYSVTSSPKHMKKGTDSKFHFRFLKRRLTEGSIKNSNNNASISVRPTPEEAAKWSNSFQHLIDSKYGQALFKAFLKREFNEENLEFWLTVEEFHKLKENKLFGRAQKIYSEYILPESPKEINLDSITRDNLINVMKRPPTHKLFDQAQKKIQNILESDSYTRFLKSDLYLELIYPENYQESILSCSY